MLKDETKEIHPGLVISYKTGMHTLTLHQDIKLLKTSALFLTSYFSRMRKVCWEGTLFDSLSLSFFTIQLKYCIEHKSELRTHHSSLATLAASA